MKKTKLRLCIMLLLIAFSSHAWENPFQDQQRSSIEKTKNDKTEEASYNITLGSLFGIYIEPGIDSIGEFTHKPEIYVTYEMGSHFIKITFIKEIFFSW